MTVSRITAVLAGAFMLAGIGGAMAQSADPLKAAEERQASMKQQGKDMEAIKGYLDGKAEMPAAQTAAGELDKAIAKIPSLIPAGTGMDKLPGKSWAKPAIWSEPDKFQAAQKNAQAKADALDAAVKGGDKAAITAAFGDMGKNGCGGCHTDFREKKT